LPEGSGFLASYERITGKFANDYEKVRHKNIDKNIFDSFYNNEGYMIRHLHNCQSFDLEGLEGRLKSSSYMPLEDDDTLNSRTNSVTCSMNITGTAGANLFMILKFITGRYINEIDEKCDKTGKGLHF
jgi:hypothetical protein